MERKLHLMMDLETQDTVPTSIVVSIGACLFDPNSDYIAPQVFHSVLNREMQDLRGRTTSERTMKWWSEQSAEARAVFSEEQTDPRVALVQLAEYMAGGVEGVWGNGSDFDNTMVADLYRNYSIAPPWQFWRNRCHRTMKAVAVSSVSGYASVKRQGTHHNALDDALHQARELQSIVKTLGLRL